MTVKPTRNNARLYAVCIPLIVLAFLFFALASFLPYAGLLQAAGGVMLTAFLFLNIRFALSEYRYVIEDTSLRIFRRQGKHDTEMANIELTSAVSLTDRTTFEQQKPAHALRYNFCQNFASKDRSYLLFVFNDVEDKRALIIFEPDEAMKAEIGKFIK